MALAQSIFTGYGWFQLFWAAFDMALTLLALQVSIGLGKSDFWAYKQTYKSHCNQIVEVKSFATVYNRGVQ